MRSASNKQSQLLQQVAAVLRATYPQTTIPGNGQVVAIGFNTYRIEVAPAFHAEGGGFHICETNDGGRWKYVDPEGEIVALGAADQRFDGNVRKLARILKQCQRECGVSIKSFQLEVVVKEFLPTKTYGESS